MKKTMLALLLLSGFGLTAGENLLKSADFAADEYGEFGVWSLTQKNAVITRLPKEGVNGADAVRLDLSKRSWISHKGLKLVGGAKYKFGGYVRTEGFSGKEYFGFMIHDANWSKSKLFRTGRFIRHTHGKWMVIENTFTAPADGMYELNIYAPGAKGKLEVSSPFVIPLDEKGRTGSQFVPPPVPKKKMTGENIIRNTDFHPDFYGEFGIWSINRMTTGITRLPGEGEGGSTAVRLDLSRSARLIHGGLRVVKGSEYKFGAYVRTAGFSGREYFGIMFHDAGWTKLFRTRKFPTDTDGKWVKVESTMTATRDGLFQFNIYAPGARGVLELCKPFVIPLDEDGVKAAGISQTALDDWRRIYPVTLDLAAMPPKTEFTVVAHCKLPDAAENYSVSAEMAGKKFSADLNIIQRVKVHFDALPLGKTELKLALIRKKDAQVVLENSYPCEVKTPVAPVPEKPFNNLVSEICRFGKLRDGEYEFTVSEEGWYFIGLDRDEKAFSIRLDGAADPVAISREQEPPDTMRYLRPGKHRLTVSGIASADNALSVRKVKRLLLFQLNVSTPAPGGKFRFTYDLDFYRRHLWHNFNTQMLQHELQTATGCDDKLRTELHARGLKIISSGDLGPKTNWTKPDIIEKNLRTANAIAYTDGRALDELGSRYPFEEQLATGDAFWNMGDFDKELYLWMAQVRGFLHYPIVNTPLLAAVGNAAGGRGCMLMETYMLSTPDQKSYDGSLTALNTHLAWADRCVPGGRSRIGFAISGYINCGAFNTWIHPQTDYKCILGGFFHKLATDPDLRGFASLGMYCITRCDEEMVRWTAAVIRHYAIEGKTENIMEKYGFAFNPGHVRNGDFDDKLENWTVSPAKADSLVHRYEKNFGKIQLRQRESGSSGDNAALFIRCAEGPNKLSQKVTGLIPGRKYSLRFVIADPDNVKKPGRKMLKFVLDARISDAKKVEQGSYLLVQPGPVGMRYTRAVDGSVTRAEVAMKQIATRKIVFIPEKPEVTITFSDWQDDQTPGDAIGQKQLLNCIGIYPYFDGK